jgi:hypothetical protein
VEWKHKIFLKISKYGKYYPQWLGPAATNMISLFLTDRLYTHRHRVEDFLAPDGPHFLRGFGMNKGGSSNSKLNKVSKTIIFKFCADEWLNPEAFWDVNEFIDLLLRRTALSFCCIKIMCGKTASVNIPRSSHSFRNSMHIVCRPTFPQGPFPGSMRVL